MICEAEAERTLGRVFLKCDKYNLNDMQENQGELGEVHLLAPASALGR